MYNKKIVLGAIVNVQYIKNWITPFLVKNGPKNGHRTIKIGDMQDVYQNPILGSSRSVSSQMDSKSKKLCPYTNIKEVNT